MDALALEDLTAPHAGSIDKGRLMLMAINLGFSLPVAVHHALHWSAIQENQITQVSPSFAATSLYFVNIAGV
tara:strand:+ start:17898 stop:18113 length:216 start_codon:yes stop_codon:yes gene_type:complete